MGVPEHELPARGFTDVVCPLRNVRHLVREVLMC